MASARSAIQLGAALLLAGALFDSPSLYVPGAGLLALAVGCPAWVRLAARGVTVTRAPGPGTVVEGEPYPLRVRIQAGRVPLPGGELRDPALERPLALGPNPPPLVSESIRMERRGRRRLQATTLAIRDPLGLSELEVSGAGATDVLVLPRTEPVVRAAGTNGDGGGAGGLGQLGEGGDRGAALRSAALASEIDGVRPHEDGVPASRIHWRTVARSGELFDRRLVPGSESSHVVVLDAAGSGDRDSLDAAVRAAASLCLHLAPSGGCALHLPGDGRPLPVDPRLAGWPRAHARLALVEAGDGPPPAVARSGRGLTLWVSSATGPPGARELARIAAVASHLVVPGEVPTLRAAFEVSGCTGYPLGAARRRAPAHGARAA